MCRRAASRLVTASIVLTTCIMLPCLGGCMRFAAEDARDDLIAKHQAELRAYEDEVDAQAEQIASEQLALVHEQEAANLGFEQRLEQLGQRQTAFERQTSRERATIAARQVAEVEAAERRIDRADAMDNALLIGLGLLGGSVPGGAGIVAGLRKARQKWDEGRQAGKVDGVSAIRDAIAEARAADPVVDDLFRTGTLGEVLKTKLPEEIQRIITADNRHRPAVVAGKTSDAAGG